MSVLSFSTYYKLPDEIKIDFVCNMDNLHKAVAIIQKSKIIGIDTEWKATSTNQKCKVDLMQIATDANIFLFDFTTFRHKEAAMKSIVNKIFLNDEIVKLGFCFMSDFSNLNITSHHFKKVSTENFNHIDICTIWRKYNKIGIPELRNSLHNYNLSELTKITLGSHLNKLERRSDWTKRP